MNLEFKKLCLIITALIVLSSTLFVSQFHNDSIVNSGSTQVHINGGAQGADVTELFLKLDDSLEVFAQQNGSVVPLVIDVDFLGRPSVSSAASSNASLSWICNGDQNYTINVRCSNSSASDSSDILVDYDVKRGDYYNIWIFPLGLIVGASLVFCGLELDRLSVINKTGKSSFSIRSREFSNLIKQKFSLANKREMFDFCGLFLLVFFVTISVLLNSSMLHNDESGGGLSNWGYYAYGYVDTVKQVSGLLRKMDFSYNSWHAVQNMNKPPLAVYLMSFTYLLFGNIDAITASRLLVQVSAALACLMVYVLGKNMFSRNVGIIASFLLFFDPIFLNYSRAAYLEVPFTLFLSLFLLFLYRNNCQVNEHKYTYLAGLFLGLAISCKSILFLYLFLPLTFIWVMLNKRSSLRLQVAEAILTTFKVGCTAIVTFFLLWPIMWINPFLKTAFQGAFFGHFGSYGPSFNVIYPVLFLGSIQRPLPIFQALTLLAYQTTYVELLGFALGIIAFLKNRKLKSNLALISFSVLMMLSSAFMYTYQHHLIYVIFPFVMISGVGYGSFLDTIVAKAKNIGQMKRYLISSGLVTLIIACQMILVLPSYPYSGLYYNTLFLGGRQPADIFQIPEPVYGLDQIAAYIQKNPAGSKIILTTNAPHIVQDYLPDYIVEVDHAFQFQTDTQTMSILRSVGFEYIIIGESTLQTNSSFQLKNTLDKSAELKFTSVENNIPVAFLYKIPAVTFKDVLWQNTGNATVWKTNSNTNSSSLNLLSNGEQVVRLNFSSGYPPSLWFKINQELSSPIDLNNASLYSIFSVNQNSNVTITLSLIDQTGTNAEIVLKNACDNYSGQYVSYMKLSDLVGSQSHVDLSRIHRVELTFYNAGKTSETIGISTFEFVK